MLVFGAVAFVLGWILFYARSTNFGPFIHDQRNFTITLLNGITFAGLLFIVASRSEERRVGKECRL